MAAGGTIAGSHFGPAGTAVGLKAGSKFGAFQSSTLWNTLAAGVKSKIANLLETGDKAGAMALAKQNGVVPPTAPAGAANVPPSTGVSQNGEQLSNTSGGGAVAESAQEGQAIRAALPATAENPGAGNRTTIKVPGKPRPGYQAQYQRKELAGINGSHNGLTFSPNAALRGMPAPALDQLMQAAQEAKASGKSLIFVKDHQGIPDAKRAAVLTEEVNHAAHRAGTGPLETHLLGSAADFVQGPLGSRAQQSLESTLRYRFNSPHEAATEIGVRLMEPGRYQELGLSRAQGHALALEYVQRLHEYGRERVGKITSRINEAFR